MRQTLPEALDAIFGTQSAVAAEPATETATAPSTSNPTAAAVPASQRERVEAAIAAYEQGREAHKGAIGLPTVNHKSAWFTVAGAKR